MKILPSLALAFAIGLPALMGRIADPKAPIDLTKIPPPVRVACVGDSITFGMGTKNAATDSYPAQLQIMLGTSEWVVRNFGVSGSTLMNSGDRPYQQQKAFADALAFNPNVVVIMLGTNDTKALNWKSKAHFVADYKDLIRKFQALPSRPRVFICRPVLVPNGGKYGINEAAIKEQLPKIASIARDTGVGVIDMHAALEGHEALLPDNVHPNAEGATRLAQTVYRTFTGKEFNPELRP